MKFTFLAVSISFLPGGNLVGIWVFASQSYPSQEGGSSPRLQFSPIPSLSPLRAGRIPKPGTGVQFHLEQAKARSARRLREGRGRPIDSLARNLHLVDEFGVEFSEPTAVLQGLTLANLQQLKQDILQYQVPSPCRPSPGCPILVGF
jgi:Conserved mid region of cactin